MPYGYAEGADVYAGPFADYAAAVAAWPNGGLYVGHELRVNRIVGSGTYGIIWTGTRWAVRMGEAPIRLEDEIALTATGTAYVQMASAIVGPLIGNYETWLFRAAARSGGVYTASASLTVRCGNTANIGSSSSITAATNRCRRIGRFRRYGTSCQRDGANGESCTSAITQDITIPDWSSFYIETGMIPGASGDTFRLEEFTLIREA